MANAGDLPIVAILHDDLKDFWAPFEGLNVWAYRFMSPYSIAYTSAPQNARIIFDNEADNDYDPTAWVAYLTQLRTARPDLVLIYPASNTARWPSDADIDAGRADPNNSGDWPIRPAIKAMCYFFALHCPTFATVKQLQFLANGWTNPWAVTEVEGDYTDPTLWDSALWQMTDAGRVALMAGATAAIQAGAQAACLWGYDPNRANAIYDPALKDWARKVNAGEIILATPTSEPDANTLQAQNGLDAEGEYKLAQALIAVMNGDKATAVSMLFDGAESTFGQLNAIDPTRFTVPDRPQ